MGGGLALVAALLGGAGAMAQAATDARFVAAQGAASLGLALAASSVLLAVALTAAGGLADRAGRARLLPASCAIAAVALASLAGWAELAPRAAAWLGFFGVKLFLALVELAFWMGVDERLDARQSVRVVPRLAAAFGAGGAGSAAVAVPLAQRGGPSAVLLGAAALLALAALATRALPSLRWVAPERAAGASAARVRTWPALADAARTLWTSALLRQLALLVAAGGAFAALLYLRLAAEAGARHSGDHALTATLSALRSAGQVVTLVTQLAVAPWLLRRLGAGWALVLAPLWALLSAAGIAAAPGLLAVAVSSVLARGLDQAIETPAHRLVHGLLPAEIRGRAVGAVEGLAKRGGAVVAGLLGAVLVAWPRAELALLALSALGYAAFAVALARRLPALAVATSAPAAEAPGSATRSPTLGPRSLEALARELAGPVERARRAAELLAELARRGHVQAVAPLCVAACASGQAWLWREAASAVAGAPGVRLPERARWPELASLSTEAACAALATCALGDDRAPLALLQEAEASDRAAVATVARLALGHRSDPARALAELADELREGTPEGREAAAELALLWSTRALAMADPGLVLACAWPLVTLVRRAHAAPEARPRALERLCELVEATASQRDAEAALLRAELGALALRLADRRGPELAEPPLAARALALLGPLARVGGGRGSEELAALAAHALGDRDEEISEAAAGLLAQLGVTAMAELLVVVGYGRRAARDRAAAVLRALPVTVPALDQLVERELTALADTALAIGALVEQDAAVPAGVPLLVRRLEDRCREIAHSVLLLVATQRRAAAIAEAALLWRHARGRRDRARALAVIDATLPRTLAARLLDAIDERPALDRARAVAARTRGELPSQREVIARELRGADALARRLLLEGLPGPALAEYRADLAIAAHQAAVAADPHALLSRLARVPEPEPIVAEGSAMPSHVETVLALSRVELFAELSTRQLDELARRARWQRLSAEQVVAVRGQPLHALVVVESGALRCGDRQLGAGSVVDELALVAPAPPADEVLAVEPSRILLLDRQALEELCDDVPGLGAALCRSLGERLRAR